MRSLGWGFLVQHGLLVYAFFWCPPEFQDIPLERGKPHYVSIAIDDAAIAVVMATAWWSMQPLRWRWLPAMLLGGFFGVSSGWELVNVYVDVCVVSWVVASAAVGVALASLLWRIGGAAPRARIWKLAGALVLVLAAGASGVAELLVTMPFKCLREAGEAMFILSPALPFCSAGCYTVLLVGKYVDGILRRTRAAKAAER